MSTQIADRERASQPAIQRRLRIVVGLDGSAASRGAMGLGGTLARAFDAGLEVVELQASRFSAARALTELAEDGRADLIVVGSAGSAASGQTMSGALGGRLVQVAPCPIAIAPPGFGESGAGALEAVGVAYEGAQRSRPALDWARRLGRGIGAKLRIVVTMNSSSAGRLDAARAALASGGPRGALEPGVNASEGLETEIAFEPSQSKALTAMRVEELDLLVLGSRRPGLVRRQSFSGLSSRLLRAALCPVVVVRGGVADHVDDSNGSAVSVAHNGAHAGTQAR